MLRPSHMIEDFCANTFFSFLAIVILFCALTAPELQSETKPSPQLATAFIVIIAVSICYMSIYLFFVLIPFVTYIQNKIYNDVVERMTEKMLKKEIERNSENI